MNIMVFIPASQNVRKKSVYESLVCTESFPKDERMVSIASESIPASRELVRNPSRVVQLYEVTRILSNVAHKQNGGRYGIHRGGEEDA